jgi:hypothetical protein
VFAPHKPAFAQLAENGEMRSISPTTRRKWRIAASINYSSFLAKTLAFPE